MRCLKRTGLGIVAIILLFCLPACQNSLAPTEPSTSPAGDSISLILNTSEPDMPTIPPPTPSPAPAPTPFSFLWLPDTQQLSYHEPEVLKSTGAWIAANVDMENLVGVLHTGDIVDNGFKEWQWENFNLALDQFSSKVPYYPVAGNHDIGVKRQDYSAYVARDFLNCFPDSQKFAGGIILYDIVEAGGLSFLLLCVGWEAARTEGAIEWLDAVVHEHADLPCILLLHGYLNGKGEVMSVARFEHDDLVAKYPNVRLVLCEHSRGYSQLSESFDDDGDGFTDRIVHAIMYNMQGADNYGALRLLRIDPSDRSLEVISFSPYLDRPLKELEEYGPLDFKLENVF